MSFFDLVIPSTIIFESDQEFQNRKNRRYYRVNYVTVFHPTTICHYISYTKQCIIQPNRIRIDIKKLGFKQIIYPSFTYKMGSRTCITNNLQLIVFGTQSLLKISFKFLIESLNYFTITTLCRGTRKVISKWFHFVFSTRFTTNFRQRFLTLNWKFSKTIFYWELIDLRTSWSIKASILFKIGLLE